MPKLLVRDGDKKGRVYLVHNEIITIGREENNTISLFDLKASRRHAEIRPSGDKFLVHDLGSTNGTYVNEKLVEEKRLEFNDTIRIGHTHLSFLADTASEDLKDAPAIPEKEEVATKEEMQIQLSIDPERVRVTGQTQFIKPEPEVLSRAYQRLITLYRIAFDIGAILDLDKLMSRVINLVITTIDAERGGVFLIDQEKKEPVLSISRERGKEDTHTELSYSNTVVNKAYQEGKSILSQDAAHDERLTKSESILHKGIKSVMAVPIKSGDEVIGILYVDSVLRPVGFSGDDLELLTAIANTTSVSMQNARLFREAQEKQAQLVEAEKLAALGRLASGVAHEINNPLTGIIGYAEMIVKKIQTGTPNADELEKWRDRLLLIEKEGKRCQNMVRNLLQFSRRKKAEMEPVVVNQILESAIMILEYSLDKARVRINRDLTPDLPLVNANADQLQQVFMNFMTNSCDAMPEGGDITIETKLIDGEKLAVSFADTGSGIPPEIQKKIFEPLFTTKGEGEGTGLGLSVTNEIVASHNGEVKLDSTVGKGTTFTVLLPVAK